MYKNTINTVCWRWKHFTFSPEEVNWRSLLQSRQNAFIKSSTSPATHGDRHLQRRDEIFSDSKKHSKKQHWQLSHLKSGCPAVLSHAGMSAVSLLYTFWSVVNTQWPLCCPCSKSWQVSEAGGLLCIRGGQQQWEFVPGAAPQWWIAGPFLWHCWQGTLLILTCPDQLTRGKHRKKLTFFIFPFYQVSCWQHYFAPSAFQWWQSELHSTHCWNQLECWHIPADWAVPPAAALVSVLLTLCRWSLFVTVINSSFVPKKRTVHTCLQNVPSVKSWCLKLFWILL